MANADILGFQADELSREKLDELITSRQSFKIFAVKDFGGHLN